MEQNTTQIIISLILLPPLLLVLWRLRIKRLKRYYSKKLGFVEVVEKYNKEKLLYINKYAQGVSIEKDSIFKSYWFCVAKQSVNYCKNMKNPQVLMLGLGANTISNLINKLNPRIHQTIVEFDEMIIQACRDFFNLDKLTNYTLIRADAYKLFNHHSLNKKKFDVIIIDIFTGKPPYVSLKSNKPSFIEKVIKFLKKDGVIIFNRPGNIKEARADSEKLKKYLSLLFNKTDLFDIKDPRGYRNNVIIAKTLKQLSL